jgi:hypothetical protein
MVVYPAHVGVVRSAVQRDVMWHHFLLHFLRSATLCDVTPFRVALQRAHKSYDVMQYNTTRVHKSHVR